MPRFPHYARRTAQLTGSVFEKFRAKMKQKGYQLVRLHIGDTYLHPYYRLPIEEEFLKKHPYFNRYCNTYGVDRLRKVLVQKVREDNGLEIGVDNLLVTNGATNALSAAVMALVDAGEEVLVLTPCWPFFRGMVKMVEATGVEVPFYTRLFEEPDLAIGDYLEQFVSDKTVALYLNSPNNPSGKVLTRGQFRQIAEFARKHRLWIISDEAYDGLTFDGREHFSIANLPEVHEQTLSIFTFSKSFMFAGLRLGYLVATTETVRAVNKIMVHQLYSPSTLTQYMMVEVVKGRREWLPRLQADYQRLRDLFLEHLRVEARVPEGTYFLFFSIEEYLQGRDYWQVIDQLMEAGVSVAPGEDFGEHFSQYIRVCFTGEPPERLVKAAERLNRVLLGESTQ